MIDVATLRRLIAYDAETGVLTWKRRPLDLCSSQRGHVIFNAQNAGKECGRIVNGYRRLRILGREYLAHRIVWAIANGSYPSATIDHINGDPLDNRLANLRDVSRETNQRNRRLIATNTSGYPGVYRRPDGRWYAQIGRSRKRHALGSFASFDEAKLARQAAERASGFIVRGAM